MDNKIWTEDEVEKLLEITTLEDILEISDLTEVEVLTLLLNEGYVELPEKYKEYGKLF